MGKDLFASWKELSEYIKPHWNLPKGTNTTGWKRGTAITGHKHKWVSYNGFTEKYDFCDDENCKEKREYTGNT